MALSTYLLKITLNVKWTKCSNQKTQNGWTDTKTIPIYMLSETCFKSEETESRWENKHSVKMGVGVKWGSNT